MTLSCSGPGSARTSSPTSRSANATNHDTLDLRGLGFASIADVLSHTDAGCQCGHSRGGHDLSLQGVTKAQLQSHAFDLLIAMRLL